MNWFPVTYILAKLITNLMHPLLTKDYRSSSILKCHSKPIISHSIMFVITWHPNKHVCVPNNFPTSKLKNYRLSFPPPPRQYFKLIAALYFRNNSIESYHMKPISFIPAYNIAPEQTTYKYCG